jgi:hypothetical protein
MISLATFRGVHQKSRNAVAAADEPAAPKNTGKGAAQILGGINKASQERGARTSRSISNSCSSVLNVL